MGGQAVSEGHGLIRPGVQSFLAPSQYASASTPPFTRRSTLALTGPNALTGAGWADVCSRVSFTLPMAPTRCRLRFRNSNLLLNTTAGQAISLTGVWWGTPNVATEPAWLGDFTAAPTQVIGAETIDPGATGAEYVTAWFTPPASALPNVLQAISYGLTVATDDTMNEGIGPGWSWHSATNTGQASSAGNAAVPTGGTATLYEMPLDVRIEWEFVGNNQIGLFIGDSLCSGYLGAGQPAAAIGPMGVDNCFPGKAALALGHAIINGGIGSAQTSTWLSTTGLAWERFDLGPGINSGVSCTPDYAVILLGFNDALHAQYVPGYQANIQSIVASLLAAGIQRVYVATVPAGPNSTLGASQGFPAGLLKTAIAAGALGTVDIVGPVVSTTAQGGAAGGGGCPGVPAQWFTSGDIVTVAGCALSGTTITNAGGFGAAHEGMLVADTTTPGNVPAGTQVVSVGATTMQVSKALTTAAADTITFNQFGIWFEEPASGIAEGPFATTAASGTTTLALTAAGTTINNHGAGCPVYSMNEGFRMAINSWLRGGVPNTVGTVDLAEPSQQPGKPAVVAVGDPSVPGSMQHWDYYSAVGNAHPSSPALYGNWAAALVAHLSGI